MTDREIEKKLQKILDKNVPDNLDKIIASCNNQTGDVIIMTKIKNSLIMKFLAAAAVLMMIIGASVGVLAQVRNYTDSVIFIDVNPSIELKVNANEKIISATALNEEAKIVIQSMDLKGTDINVAVNAIIGSMLVNGYLSELNNSVLVSVENKDTEKGAELQKKLMAEVNEMLNVSSIDGAVLSQTVTADDQIKKIADDCNISIGKATLIAQIIEAEKDYRDLNSEMLAALSINELNLILNSQSVDVSGLSSIGMPSDKSYIGEDAAKKIAYEHAKLTDTDVTYSKIKLDTEDGIIVYDIDFNTAETEYDYEINAQNGEIISFDVDMEYKITTKTAKETSGGTETYIGLETAKNIAFTHAGFNEVDSIITKAKLDIDDNKAEYDIEFIVNATEYEYEIDAVTGSVLSVDTETDKKIDGNNNTGNYNSETSKKLNETDKNANIEINNNAAVPSYISLDEAKAAAFNHAGVTESEIILEKAKFDIDDGQAEYEIEFRIGSVEYEYDIDAYTGAIINCEKDIDD